MNLALELLIRGYSPIFTYACGVLAEGSRMQAIRMQLGEISFRRKQFPRENGNYVGPCNAVSLYLLLSIACVFVDFVAAVLC